LNKEKSLQVVYAGEAIPGAFSKSIYLAGPSPRVAGQPNWRPEALRELEQTGYDGVVFVPVPRDGARPEYESQRQWEKQAMNHADVALFWVPRSDELLGLTTNVEFGALAASGKVVLGTPPDATSVRYLQSVATDNAIPTFSTLAETAQAGADLVARGAQRQGGECQVPLHIWRTKQFQSWITRQKAAGNRLDGAELQWVFRVGPNKKIPLAFALHVDVYVEAEGRNKSNEFILSRPDIAHTVAIWPHPNDSMKSRVVLVREFRSTSSTADGFIRETPGGSGFKEQSPQETAAAELREETGLEVDPQRVYPLGTRQVAGTFSTHSAHVGVVRLTKNEIDAIEGRGGTFGNAEETELTYAEVYTLGQLSADEITDWATMGMIMKADRVARSLPFPLGVDNEPAIVAGSTCRAYSLIEGEVVAFNLNGGGRGHVSRLGTVRLNAEGKGFSVTLSSTGDQADPFKIVATDRRRRSRSEAATQEARLMELFPEIESVVRAAGGVEAVFADPSSLEAVSRGIGLSTAAI
jgi:8-oxo-dGTP pyrophosphatase MutT (NUDIX family)/nucleoside 2-deoxyribosyltransferase